MSGTAMKMAAQLFRVPASSSPESREAALRPHDSITAILVRAADAPGKHMAAVRTNTATTPATHLLQLGAQTRKHVASLASQPHANAGRLGQPQLAGSLARSSAHAAPGWQRPRAPWSVSPPLWPSRALEAVTTPCSTGPTQLTLGAMVISRSANDLCHRHRA